MGNMTLEQVNDMYLDVLREIGNIEQELPPAIANMLGMKIDMNVPSIRLMEVSQLGMAVGAEDETIVGIFLEVETDIEGSMPTTFWIFQSASFICQQVDDDNEPDDQVWRDGTFRIKRDRQYHCGILSVRIVLPD